MTYLKLKLNQIPFLKAKIKSRTTHFVAQNIKHHYYEKTGRDFKNALSEYGQIILRWQRSSF